MRRTLAPAGVLPIHFGAVPYRWPPTFHLGWRWVEAGICACARQIRGPRMESQVRCLSALIAIIFLLVAAPGPTALARSYPYCHGDGTPGIGSSDAGIWPDGFIPFDYDLGA